MHLPVRVRALKAAPDTAGLYFLMKGFALHPFGEGERGNSPMNPNLLSQKESSLQKEGALSPEAGEGSGERVQQPPQQQENSRTMRTIQIQLLLSNTLHRQLFIANLLKRYEVGRRASVSTTIVCRRGASVREKGGKKKKDAETAPLLWSA